MYHECYCMIFLQDVATWFSKTVKFWPYKYSNFVVCEWCHRLCVFRSLWTLKALKQKIVVSLRCVWMQPPYIDTSRIQLTGTLISITINKHPQRNSAKLWCGIRTKVHVTHGRSQVQTLCTICQCCEHEINMHCSIYYNTILVSLSSCWMSMLGHCSWVT